MNKTIFEISSAENDLVLCSEAAYGKYFIDANNIVMFLGEFIESIDVDAYLFGFFLSQIQVSSKLSLLSVLRLHDVQAGMNMRQALEAAVRAVYTLKFPDENLHIIKKEDGTVEEKGNFKSSCHKWLETEYPLHSAKIKGMKDIINDTFMHANLIAAASTFDISSDKYWSGFFDKEDASML